jgi:hypothetical protein
VHAVPLIEFRISRLILTRSISHKLDWNKYEDITLFSSSVWSLLEFAFLVQSCAAISDAGRESTRSEASAISDGDLYYG